MSRTLFFDIEADNLLLKATKVWCVVAMDTHSKEIFHFRDIDKAVKFLSAADTLIGHNIVLYDIPVLRKLHNLSLSGHTIFDTLLVSRILQPDRIGGHGLKAWGEKVGSLKGDHKDFSQYSDEMMTYCVNDVEVTAKVYERLQSEMKLVGLSTEGKWFKLEHEFAAIINKQIEAGFKLDVPKVEALYRELGETYASVYNVLSQMLPPIKDDTHYKSIVNKKKLLSETSSSYTYICGKTDIVKTKDFKYTECNPGSRQQIAAYLMSRGWVPSIRTDTGLPKIDEKILGGIELPEAKMISQMFRAQKQMSMIKSDTGGWLTYVDPVTHRVHGDVLTNSTNTGRCSHARPNMAQVDKRDKRMREVWIPKEGWQLVGVDASSLELRVLAHYLYPYDKGAFTTQVVSGDVHTYNQEIMGLGLRDSAKTMIYALIYGAGNAKLGTVFAKDQHDNTTNEFKLRKYGKGVRDNVEDGFTGYKELLTDVTKAYKARGYLKGVDGRVLNPRTDYSALNLLIQSAGAIIMKQALINMYEMFTAAGLTHGVDYNFVANVHDESQLECSLDKVEVIKELSVKAIEKTQRDFNLNVFMTGEAKSGNNWGDTH